MSKADEERHIARLAARADQIVEELDDVIRQINLMLREKARDDDPERTG